MSAVFYVVAISIAFTVAAALIMTVGVDYANDDEWLLAYGSPASSTMRDCQSETVYSMTDNHCRTQCKPPGIYNNVDGICVNVTELSEGAPYRDKCDPKKGVIPYVVGDGQFGTLDVRCMSIDPGIQPDNVYLPNRICSGNVASVEIDYISQHGFPSGPTACVKKIAYSLKLRRLLLFVRGALRVASHSSLIQSVIYRKNVVVKMSEANGSLYL